MDAFLMIPAALVAMAFASGVDTSSTATAPATRVDNQVSTADPLPPPADQRARYRVTVRSTWTSASHPSTLPSNSHFSPSVVATHGTPGSLFARGSLASNGIERMAETGSTGTLVAELSANGDVTASDVGRSIFGVGENTFEVTLDQGSDLVSLVTMLAPSPDWFVGVSDVDLFVDGSWIERVDLDLGVYDAGTDNGSGFRSPNSDTSPATVISGPSDPAFVAAVAEGRFGNVVVERIS